MAQKKWTAEDIAKIQQYAQEAISLDILIDSEHSRIDEESRLIDFIVDDAPSLFEVFLQKEDRSTIIEAIHKLRPREIQVLLLRYGFVTGDVMTLEEIGQRYNITRERVRQIEEKALANLHEIIKEEYRDQYEFYMPAGKGGEKDGRK